MANYPITMIVPLTQTLIEQLANRLSQQAGKSLVIPEGEGTNERLGEFNVIRSE